MQEIKELFGKEKRGQEDNEDVAEMGEQIARLREIIDENKRLIEGERMGYYRVEQERERKEKEEAEKARKQMEDDAKREQMYAKQREDEQKKDLEDMDNRRVEVVN